MTSIAGRSALLVGDEEEMELGWSSVEVGRHMPEHGSVSSLLSSSWVVGSGRTIPALINTQSVSDYALTSS